jgi:hypothetical protein
VIKLTLAANDAPRQRMKAAETPSAERRSSQESDPINASSGLRISADNGLAVIKLTLAANDAPRHLTRVVPRRVLT